MRRLSTKRAFLVAAVAATSIAAGCTSPSEIDAPYVWEGEHVVVRSDAPLEKWCAGSLSSVDAFVAEAKRVHETPKDAVVTSYVLADPLESYGVCPSYVSPETGQPAGGCAIEQTVYTRGLTAIQHELIHAVRAYHDLTPRFFEEGAASYWSGDAGAVVEDWTTLSLQATFAASRERFMTPSEYMLAASFTSYLVYTYGAPAQAEFLRRVDWDASLDEVETAFLHTNGVSLQGAFEDYHRNWPKCSLGAMGLASDCAGEAIPLACNTWGYTPSPELELDLSCDDPDTVGPLPSSLGSVVRQDVVLELTDPSATTIFLGIRPDDWDEEATIATFKACTADCAKAEPIQVPTNGVAYAILGTEPGRYLLRITRPAGSPAGVRVSWSCDS